MCTICSSFRPYSTGCDYAGLPNATGTASLATSAAVAADLDTMANYLTDGFWLDAGGDRHTFDTSSSNDITVNITGLTAEGKQLARWAMEALEAVADVEFVEVNGNAQIMLDDNSAGAVTGYSALGQETVQAEINVSTNWLNVYGTQMGGYGFHTYLHELAHALGLGHQGAYGGSATYGKDETFANDSWQLSVMSYFDQNQNTSIKATRAETVTMGMVDIVALQNLYGAPDSSSLTAGATTYGANHTLGNSWLGKLTDAFMGVGSASVYDGTDFSFTIYDRNGYDVIDFSFDTKNQKVDLNEESISSVFGLTGNMMIARDTVIEEYRAGIGNDKITGNDADNVILGGKGEDKIEGGDGDDYLQGDRNKDTLSGGDGNDLIIGGKGNDTLNGDSGKDDLQGGYSNDKLNGGGGGDKLHGGDGKDKLAGGRGSDSLTGGKGNDTLKGNGGSDTFLFKTGDGSDVVQDFDALDNKEVIHLKKVTAITSYADLMDSSQGHIQQKGAHVIITDGAGLEITLQNVDLSDLDANDFIF